MKQSAELDHIQQQMRPGVITREGFLGTDPRHLGDILIADNATVNRLGVTHKAIATRMQELRDHAARGLGEFISVPPHFEVRVDGVRGKLPSPFGPEGLFPKTNTTVRNTALDKEIIFTDLQIHLIANHGFYQGRGGTYRLDPELLVALLEIPATGFETPPVPGQP